MPGGKSHRHVGDTRAPPLVTQFTPPSPPFGLVERPRLSERIARPREPVTLVCGPAGSGKTALLSSVLGRASDERVAWVSLEPGDDDPARFWEAILTSLSLAGAAPAGSALAALAAPVRDSRNAFMPLLVNALAELPEPVVLVLDDVHVARSRECLSDLGFLVLHAPDTLRLVLGARADPAIPLHVLRVRGRLVEVRAADLAFTESEAAALFVAHGVDLAPDLVAALCARTEGWGAGLRLAAHSLQGRDDPERFVKEFAGDDRVVGDYLLAEVLDRQPPRLRTFLLRTSIVDRVCGDLADALTSQGSSSDILAELERTNGFVLGVDSRREWFRYHLLFAKLLRTRAARELGDELPRLHDRAARWYAAHGMGSEALQHAVSAANWDLAVELVAEHWFDLFVRGQGSAIRTLVDVLPAERQRGDAELAAALACAAFEVGDAEAGASHLQHARDAEAVLPPERRRRYLETLALARLYCARLDGDFESALEAADELLAEAAEHGGWSDDARQALVRASLGRTALWAHRLDRARTEFEHSVSQARAAGLDYVAVSAQSALGLLAVMQRGPVAAACAREAVELAGRRGWGTILETATAHAALALAAFYDLRRPEAQAHLDRARDALSHGRTRHVEFMLDHLEARMAGAMGHPEEGLRALATFEVTHRRGAPSPYERASLASMRARLHAAAGDLETANAVLAPVRGEGWLDVEVTAARLLLAAGEPEAAIETLERARAAGAIGVHNVAVLEHAVLEAIARDTAGEPEPAPRGDRARARARRGERAPVVVHRGRPARRGAAARPHPQRHGAPRDRRRAARRVRGARRRAPAGRAAAGAAQRARVRDPALPADDALQPRDRRRAVRDHQHGQDAPAQHLPQARRRSPARSGRARP